ncbi:MAG: hypothetical protein CME45_06745 [Halieaceae bacterium]|nr:hypothetical protein [Halieaceae bacterium]
MSVIKRRICILDYIPPRGIIYNLKYPPGVYSRKEVVILRTETKRIADARLARIEGQIRAVRKMVNEDRYCVDVVRQVQAARSALSSLETVIVEDHVDTCVQASLESGSTEARREKVIELVSILTGKKK